MKKQKKKITAGKYSLRKKSYNHVVIGILSMAFGLAGVYLMITQVVSSIIYSDYSNAASMKKYQQTTKKDYLEELVYELNTLDLNALDSNLQ